MFKVGQELHIGEGFSGVIYHTNETQVAVTTDGAGGTKTFYKASLAKLVNSPFAALYDEPSDYMRHIHEKAREYAALIDTYTPIIHEAVIPVAQ